jgi:hypothetical protein
MEFDYRIIGLISIIILFVIGVMLFTSMGGKLGLPEQLLTMQMGIQGQG